MISFGILIVFSFFTSGEIDKNHIRYTVLKNGNVNMTEQQWDNWAAGPITEDEPYQLDAIATNLGLTRA